MSPSADAYAPAAAALRTAAPSLLQQAVSVSIVATLAGAAAAGLMLDAPDALTDLGLNALGGWLGELSTRWFPAEPDYAALAARIEAGLAQPAVAADVTELLARTDALATVLAGLHGQAEAQARLLQRVLYEVMSQRLTDERLHTATLQAVLIQTGAVIDTVRTGHATLAAQLTDAVARTETLITAVRQRDAEMTAQLTAARAQVLQVQGDQHRYENYAPNQGAQGTFQGDVRTTSTQGGDYADRDVNKMIINIYLGGNNTENTDDPKSHLISTRQQWADQLYELLSPLTLPVDTLRRAFRDVAPFHELPEQSDDLSVLQSILSELRNKISAHNPIEQFAHELLNQPDVNSAQKSALYQFLGLPEKPQTKREDAGLLIAIDTVPHNNEHYYLIAWEWPSGRRLWPAIGEDMSTYSARDIPAAIKHLHRSIYSEIARFGDNLRIELMLHYSLLVEPSHEWEVMVLLDENDPDAMDLLPLSSAGRTVVIRSVERAFSKKGSMVRAREIWRERWKNLETACKQEWQRPYEASATQLPPIFCPTVSGEFIDGLSKRLSDDDYVCFVETTPPPEGIDFAKEVVRRVIINGLPLGLWFANNADRQLSSYEHLAELLQPRQLSNLPEILRQHWKRRLDKSPLLFYDDPNRLPNYSEEHKFESPARI